MAKQLSILLVSSEVFPFSKESDLADVTSSLALQLKDMGNDARIMMPKYGHISERKNRIHDINRLKDMPVPINGSEDFATIKSSSIQNSRSKVQTYVTTNDQYFNKLKGVYHAIEDWTEFENNIERFVFFSRSVVETCVLLEWFPNVIHCNDWQTALIPAIAKLIYPEKFAKTKFVLTVHNFENQGVSEWKDFELTGLPKEAGKDFKHKNMLNILKGGLVYADHITTVSKTYAEDLLKTATLSDGLNATLKKRKDEFTGILNGIDKWIWNPAKDDFLKYKIEDQDFENFKYNNKVEIANTFGLEYHPSRPMFGIISNFNENSGIDILIDSADEILKNDIQFVLLGQANADYRKKLDAIQEKYPEKFKVKYQIDEILNHLLKAGVDYLVMPSEYEPSGLNLMYSCTYGTVPIVQENGGVSETIEEWNAEEEEGFAIKIAKHDSKSFVSSINQAMDLFKDRTVWELAARNGMYEEFGWDENAEEYQEIYKNLVKK